MVGLVAVNEYGIQFFKTGGHNHDGENSSPVYISPKSIGLQHLGDDVTDYIARLYDINRGSSTSSSSSLSVPLADLEFTTPPIAAGSSYEGSVTWTGLTIVHHLRIIMTRDTECTISFYHADSYNDEDLEFRAEHCSNRFLWEGLWTHYNEMGSNTLFYKIENTGNTSSIFRVTLKSATMAANIYASYVQQLSVESTDIEGEIALAAGPGVSLDVDGQTITISAEDAETLYVSRWASTPTKPATYSTSATLTDAGGGLTGFGTGTQYVSADIGSIVNLSGIKIFFGDDDRVLSDVIVEISDNGSFWSTVKSEGDVWAMGPLEIYFPRAQMARYVRLWANGNDSDNTNIYQAIVPMVISDKE